MAAAEFSAVQPAGLEAPAAFAPDQELEPGDQGPPLDGEGVRDGPKAFAVSSNKPLTSKFRGVCWNKKNKRWQAAINSSGKYLYLGSYDSEEDAARVFDKAAVRIRYDKARLNYHFNDYVDENGQILPDQQVESLLLEACNPTKPRRQRNKKGDGSENDARPAGMPGPPPKTDPASAEIALQALARLCGPNGPGSNDPGAGSAGGAGPSTGAGAGTGGGASLSIQLGGMHHHPATQLHLPSLPGGRTLDSLGISLGQGLGGGGQQRLAPNDSGMQLQALLEGGLGTLSAQSLNRTALLLGAGATPAGASLTGNGSTGSWDMYGSGSSATAAALAALQGGGGGSSAHQNSLAGLLGGPLGSTSLLRNITLGGPGDTSGLGLNVSPALLQELMAGPSGMSSLRPSVLSLGPTTGASLDGLTQQQLHQLGLGRPGSGLGSSNGGSLDGLNPQQLSQLNQLGLGAPGALESLNPQQLHQLGLGGLGSLGGQGQQLNQLGLGGHGGFSAGLQGGLGGSGGGGGGGAHGGQSGQLNISGGELLGRSQGGMGGGTSAGDGGAGAAAGGGAGMGAAAGAKGDMFAAIKNHLPPGAELDSIMPSGNPDVVGVLYSFPGSDKAGAAIWNGRTFQGLGQYGSERDAKQAIGGALALYRDMAQQQQQQQQQVPPLSLPSQSAPSAPGPSSGGSLSARERERGVLSSLGLQPGAGQGTGQGTGQGQGAGQGVSASGQAIKTEVAYMAPAGWQPDPTCEDPQEPSPPRGGAEGGGVSEDESGTGAGAGGLGGGKRRREDGSASNGLAAGPAQGQRSSQAAGAAGATGGAGAGAGAGSSANAEAAYGTDDPVAPDDPVGATAGAEAVAPAAKRPRGPGGAGGGGDLHTLQHLANIDVREALRMFYNGKQQS